MVLWPGFEAPDRPFRRTGSHTDTKPRDSRPTMHLKYRFFLAYHDFQTLNDWGQKYAHLATGLWDTGVKKSIEGRESYKSKKREQAPRFSFSIFIGISVDLQIFGAWMILDSILF